MPILKNKITFDSFIRGLIGGGVILLLIVLLNYLSSILVPFFVAWFLAYMIEPMVHFIQKKLGLKNRILSVVFTFLLLLIGLVGILYLLIPPIIEELVHTREIATLYLEQGAVNSSIPLVIEKFMREYVQLTHIEELWNNKNLIDFLGKGFSSLWTMISQTAGVLMGIFAWIITFFYLFFILIDYDQIRREWVRFVPVKQRKFAKSLVSDVENGMQKYFRGQALVAFCVGVLFSIGFLIIDFPLAIVLGMFIGLLNLVPYLQVVGFIPMLLLALLKAVDTGDNFWFIIGGALLVFAIVQLIQDIFLVPRIMGKIMGLSPTVILLSLSIWGYVLGLVGLIIALPLTTLCISYYKRYVVTEDLDKE